MFYTFYTSVHSSTSFHSYSIDMIRRIAFRITILLAFPFPLAKCVVEYQLEDGSSSYVRIQKPSRQVVLSDIKAFSPNPNGVFLFKTVEADSFVWAVWVDESAPVPSHSQDLITCKVKPYGRFALK